MTLTELASIATIVQGVFVIVSLGVIVYQSRENLRLTRAANTEHLADLSSPFNLQLIQDREMAKLWVLGAKEWSKMDEVDKYRFDSLVIWWLLLHENIYYQWEKKLLDNETYAPWDNDLRKFIVEKDLKQHWDRLNVSLQQAFAKHILQIIEASAEKKTSAD